MTNHNSFINRSIRVFISSTFRDMMEERDALMSHTWPQLKSFCRERQVELVEVDLRWGISEEQSTGKETLKLCLNEIKACRPFFIGLLGERYGWVPGDDAFTADLKEEQSWLNHKDINGKSVTELEILHGVLNNPKMAGRAFFYFRDPKYIESVPAEKRADFLSEDAISAEKQNALKNVIRTTCKSKNIPLLETYPNPLSLASIILEQLKEAIENQFPIEAIPDPLTRETRDHEAFADIRRRTYIERPDYYNTLDNYCNSNGKPVLLLGESGSGKSALIANWVEHWRKEHPEDFIYQHYIGGTSDSADYMKIILRLIKEIKKWTNDTADLPKNDDEAKRDFYLWLSKTRLSAEHKGVKFIVALDALNQLEDKDYSRVLGWLPTEPFKNNLKLITSTLPGDTYKAIEKRGLEVLKIEALTRKEQKEMIEHYLHRFGKKLDEQRLLRITNSSQTSNPLFLKILLDELRITGTHDKLDEKLNEYLSADDIPTLLQKVITRYLRDYEKDRPGLVGETLSFIWCARRGLTETELLELLKPENLPQLPQAIWSPFRAALEESLIERGGILNFAHNYFKSAVEKLLLPDLDAIDDVRIILADYFEAKIITARNSDELPWLLMKTELFKRLKNCLLNLEYFLEIDKKDSRQVYEFWNELKETENLGCNYVISFHKWEINKSLKEKIFSAMVLARFLREASFFNEAKELLKEALDSQKRNYYTEHFSIPIIQSNLACILEDLCEFKESNELRLEALELIKLIFPSESIEIAAFKSNLAEALHKQGKLKESKDLFNEVIELYQKQLPLGHLSTVGAQAKLARVYKDLGDFFNAKNLLNEALKSYRNYYPEEQTEIAIIMTDLASVQLNLGELKDAKDLLEKVLQSTSKNYPPEHPYISTIKSNLAVAYLGLGKILEAKTLLKESLESDKKNYPPRHPSLAITKSNLALVEKALGEFIEAKKLLKEALEVFIEYYPKDYPDLALTKTYLAIVLRDLGELKEAKVLFIEALESLKNIYPQGHEHIIMLKDILRTF